MPARSREKQRHQYADFNDYLHDYRLIDHTMCYVGPDERDRYTGRFMAVYSGRFDDLLFFDSHFVGRILVPRDIILGMSDSIGMVIGSFVFSGLIAWTSSATIYGIKSLFFAGFGRNGKSI